ncbi:MAG: EamA family transporter [Methyloligellaceae bacterium]
MYKLTQDTQGLIWCLVFVILDSVQAVYFGSILQKQDAFLVGGLVFGISSLCCFIWTFLFDREQVGVARDNIKLSIGLGFTTAGAWITYFYAIQLIEPAIAFAILCGLVPLVTIVAAKLNYPEAHSARNRMEAVGNLIIFTGLLYLSAMTLYGWSGFVRGGIEIAALGILSAIVSGSLFALMLLYGQRLNTKGLKPIAQFGTRYPIYTLLAVIGYYMGLDAKAPTAINETMIVVFLGFFLLAFPIYAVQKAVSLTTALTIGSLAATAPVFIFILQLLEGRVQYSGATFTGLVIYFAGAILAGVGTAKAVVLEKQKNRLQNA